MADLGKQREALAEDLAGEREAILLAITDERTAIVGAIALERDMVLEGITRERTAALEDIDAQRRHTIETIETRVLEAAAGRIATALADTVNLISWRVVELIAALVILIPILAHVYHRIWPRPRR